jgi:hypothetical protein
MFGGGGKHPFDHHDAIASIFAAHGTISGHSERKAVWTVTFVAPVEAKKLPGEKRPNGRIR